MFYMPYFDPTYVLILIGMVIWNIVQGIKVLRQV